MRLKRILCTVTASLMLLGTVFFANGDSGAFAASVNDPAINEDDIYILYELDSVIVDESKYGIDTSCPELKDEKIYFTESYTTDLTKWSEVLIDRNGYALFDTSWAKTQQAVKIYLCGDKNFKVVSFTIMMQPVLNAKFYGNLLSTDITDAEGWKEVYANYPLFGEDTGYIIFTIRDGNRDRTYMELENIEWRKGQYGNWRDFSEFNPHEIEVRGSQIEFRIMSKNEISSIANPERATDAIRYSSVAKLSVPKINNGPLLTITKLDGTLSIKNGMEFSIDNGEKWILIPTYYGSSTEDDYLVTEAEKADWISSITTKTRVNKLLIQEILNLKSSEAVEAREILVRTACTERLPASKITKIELPGTSVFSGDDLDNVSMSYVSSRTGQGGIQINNSNDFDLQLCVLAPVDAGRLGITLPDTGETLDPADYDNLPVTSMTWTTLKANSYSKVTFAKAAQGSMVVLRRGYTDTELPSAYRIFPSMVDYTSAITFANISGTPKNGYSVKAEPSSNLLNVPDEDFTFKWQWAESRNAADADWTDLGAAFGGNNREVFINTDVPEGETLSTYQVLNRKYLRVKITYNGVTCTSQPVGPVVGQ